MGPPGKSSFGQTFLSLLFQQNPDLNPIFGFWLGNLYDWQGMGQLIIGGIDTDHLKGPITWSPSLSPNSWILSMNAVKLGDRHLASHPQGALLDTGSSLLVAPRSIYRDIIRLLGATPHPTRKGLHQVITIALFIRLLVVGRRGCHSLVFKSRVSGII